MWNEWALVWVSCVEKCGRDIMIQITGRGGGGEKEGEEKEGENEDQKD